MDFGSLMKAEIAKKSAQLESKNIVNNEKKSFKRSELYNNGFNGLSFRDNHTEAKRARDTSNMVYNIDKDYIPQTVNVADDDIAKTIFDTENEVSRHVKGSKKRKRKGAAEKLIEDNLPPRVVRKRLRERKEPVKLFGETDHDTYVRFRRYELQALGSARYTDSWLRNDYKYTKERQKREEISAMLKREMEKSYNEPSALEKANDPSRNLMDKEFRYDIKLPDIEEFVKPLLPSSIEDYDQKMDDALAVFIPLGEKLKKGTRQHEMDLILWTFRFLQLSWGIELNKKRNFLQKKSVKGRAQTSVYKATEESLEPLFIMLRNHNLPSDIALHFANMTRCMLVDRNYVLACDSYMQLAIGNSPWPLGITNTQIHVRPGHEKIKARHIAHVFNDETQRRYIQSCKRLMTFAQRVWPCDPSKCVDFHSSRPEYDLLAASSVDNTGAPVVNDPSL